MTDDHEPPTDVASTAASTPTPSPAPETVQRINRAIDHVIRHLDAPLTLEAVARAASVSPFHFHRVFKAVVGETVHGFVKRVRLEHALTLMARDPNRPLTEVALACGFNSSSEFSRSFRQHFGTAPSRFDLTAHRGDRRRELESLFEDPELRHRIRRLPAGENPDGFTVRLRDLPPRTVAYIRVLDPFRPDVVAQAARDLVAWAEDHGVADRQWLGYMWEDPEIVALADCRYDVAVEVDDVIPKGRIGRFDFPAMRVADIEIRGPIDLEQRALDWMYGTWLPSSRFLPADQPAFEAWIGRPFAHGTEHFELHLQLPVVER